MISCWKILVASSDLENRRAVANILITQGLDPICAGTVAECRQVLENEDVVLVFCDRHITDGGHREVLRIVRSSKTRALVVITSRQGQFDWDEYLEAMRLGAFDVIASPCLPTDVEWMVLQAGRYVRSRASRAVTFDTASTTYCEMNAPQTA
jgi:two-component system response regulator PilR (NtrC family)